MSTADQSPNGAFGQGIINDTGTVILATAPGGLGAYDQGGQIVVNGINYGPAPFADSQGNIPINNQVQAGTLVISTNGTLLVNLPGQVAITGPDPQQTWDNLITGATVGTYGAGATTAGGVVAATTSPNTYTTQTISDILGQSPIINANSLTANIIIVRAATVNLDGVIQSGQSDYKLTLGAQASTDIQALIASGVTQVTALAHQPSTNFVVYWQPSGGGSILVSPTRITGGDVEITGNVVNTGNGQIKVLGGYGKVNITNNTSYSIEVQKLDVSSPGIGTLLINDTSAIGQVTFDANALRNPGVAGSTTKVVDIASSTIAVAGNPGVVTGEAVTYNTQGSTAIGGLTNGTIYFVAIQGDGTFRLYVNQGDANANNGNFVHFTGSVTAAMGPVQAFNFTPGNLASGRQAGHVYTTLYQESAGNIAVTTDNGVSAATTSYNQPTSESYAPMSTWRYGWTVGVTETVKAFAIETSSSWIGLISTGSSYTGPFTSTIPQGVPQLVGAGPYYYTDGNALPNGYAFSATTIITSGSPSLSSKALGTTTTWYGTTTITVEHDSVFGQQVLDTHTISGSRPVGISFIGDNQGTVTVKSQGNVIVGGPILNPTGTTSITSQGSIETAGNIGLVGGAQVKLQAQTGIGDIGGPLQIYVAPVTIPFDPTQAGIVDTGANSINTGPAAGLKTGVNVTYNAEGNSAIGSLADGASYFVRYNAIAGTIQLYDTQANAFAGGATGLYTLGSTSGAGIQQKFTIVTTAPTRLDATTATGAIDLAQVAAGGDLPIGVVSSQSLGAVTLLSHGSILVANGGPDPVTGGPGLVFGGAITLIAANNVGNSIANPLLIDTPSATNIAGDRLTVAGLTQSGATSASPVSGNVYLMEKSGDLQVNTINAAGDVWINVPNGSLINANTTATIDQRTQAQLLSGVWSALSLTDATGYHQQLNAVVSTYVSAQEQSYQTYWQFRSEQANPSVYDPNFQVTLTAAQLAYYQSINYTVAQITTLENAQTAEYHVLAAEFSGFDNPIADVANSTIYLGGSPVLAALQTGDQVTYVPGATAAIAFTQGGLAYTGPLFARNNMGSAQNNPLYEGLVKLYSSETAAQAGGAAGLVNFAYAAAGSGVAGVTQSFTFSPSIHFNPATATSSSPGAVNIAADSIYVGASSGLTTGEAVTYDSAGNAVIGGLTGGGTYYVQVQNDGTVRLYTSNAAALAGASPTTVQFNPSSAASVSLIGSALIVGNAGGLTSGQQVTYDSQGNGAVGGLTSLTNYFVNVQNVVDLVNSAIFVGYGSGLTNGQSVVYNAQGHAVVGGLTNGATYYVHLQSNGAIRLYASPSDATAGNANFVALTTTGGGAAQQFNFGVGQSVTFNPGAVALRLYTDATNATTGGATNLVALTSLGAGAQSRLVAANTGLVLLGPGAGGADQNFTISATTNTLSFNPTGTTIHRDAIVNTTANSPTNPLGSSIYVGFTSGLQTGDGATYNPGAGNAPIAPLTTGFTYYVNVQSNGTILLYDTEADAMTGGATGLISLTSTGGGTAQSFAFSPSVHFNPTAPSVVNPGSNSLFLAQGNGLVAGDAVQYDTEGSAASFGLTNSQTYYVNILGDGSVTFYLTQAQALAGGSTGLQALSATSGAGADQKLIVLSQPAKVTFNPNGTTNFIYTPTAQQIEALTAGIKKWTPNELLYGISQGLLTNSVTDTVVSVQQTPDVAGAHVTLLTSGSVGKNAATVQIPIVPGGTFTTAQLLALATAERSDLQFLGAAPTNAIVDFAGNSITLISDGGSNNWLNDGFAVGDYVSIAGAPQNSTSGGSLDQIVALTSTVMTLSKTVSSQTHTSITIAPVVTNPVFQALPLTNQTAAGPESVNVNFIANGFDNVTLAPTPGEIVRSDSGSWSADGFKVGDLVQLTGAAGSNNSTGAGLAYTVTAITDASAIAFNPTAPGVVNTTLETIFVGANTGLATGNKITYNDQGHADIGGLTNSANYYVYVEGDGSFELYDTAAHANAGGAAGRVALGLSGNGYGGQQSFAIDSAISAHSTLVLSNRDVIFTEGTSVAPESISIGRGQSPTIAQIQVAQVAPVWINASSQLDVIAGSSVFIDSRSNVRINQVVAGGTPNYQGNIRVYTVGSGTSVVNASVSGAPNLEGQNLILEAGSGGIGGAGGANPITIDLVDHGTLTARAQSDVSILAVMGALPGDNLGNIYLASVYSSSGNAYLTAQGGIIDAFGDISTVGKETQVQANNIYLIALSGAIGGLVSGTPDFIGIQASQTGSVYAYALNNIYLYQTSLNLNIGEVFSLTGDVNLLAQTYIYNQPNQITDVFGNNITLTSILTGIGTAANNVSIYSHYGYDHGTNLTRGTLTASAITDSTVNIYILQNDNPPATVALFPANPLPIPAGSDNIYLNTIITGASDVAFITAPLGSILNSGQSAEDVQGVGGVGGNTLLFALNNIGAANDPISTAVGHIEGQSTLGSTWITNTGALSIGGTLISGSSTGLYAGKSIVIVAQSPVTVSKSAISEGDINITANNDGSGGDNIVVAAVTLTGAPLVLQALGNIVLTAGNNITINGPTTGAPVGAVLRAGTSISVTTPAKDGVKGNVITIGGELVAPTIILHGGPADSVIQVTTGALDATYPWTPSNWPFATPPAGLPAMSYPSNPSQTSQISIFGDSGAEQILLWGSLTAARTDVYAGTGFKLGNGDALIALNPLNADGYTLNTLAITGPINLWGNAGNDTFIVNDLGNVDLAHKSLTAGASPTSIDPGLTAPGVTSVRAVINVSGGVGSNQYEVNLTGASDYIVNVTNTDHAANPTDGTDTLTINGAPGVDTFLLRTGFVALLQYSGGVVQSNYERINYNASINVLNVNGLTPYNYVYSDAPGTVAQVNAASLTLPGYASYAAASLSTQSHFYVDGNSAITTLTGADGGDTFQFGQVFGSARVGGSNVQFGDQMATIEVAVGQNALGGIVTGYLTSGPMYATTAYGGLGNDNFFVYSNKAPLKLYGEAGNDDFVVRAFALATGTGVSTALTTITTGSGSSQIEYNINAPVAIDGGSGVNTVTVLGSGFGDSFVITNQGVEGAGLNVSMTNVSILQIDGVAGNNAFYVLSTAPGEVVTLIGGTGNNNTFNIAGDVTTPVIAQNLNGVSGLINNSVSSADPNYSGAYAPGVSVNVANGTAGTVVVGQLTAVGASTPIPQLFENPLSGPNVGQYTINLAANPTANVYLTVAAALRPYQDTSAGAASLEVSTDGVHWSQSRVLTFTASNFSALQTVFVKAFGDNIASGQQTIVISHSTASANAAFNDLAVSNLEVNVIDQTLADAVLTPAHTGNLQVVAGNSSGFTAQNDSFTVQLNRPPVPGEIVTVTLNSEVFTTHNYLALSSSAAAQFTQTATGATITFNATNWNTPITVNVGAASDGGVPFNPTNTIIQSTVTSSGGVSPLFNQDIVQHKLTVNVIDSAVPQVFVNPTTPILVSPTQSGSYTLQLTTQPTANVVVSLLDNGQTLLSSASAQFNNGNPPTVTFTPGNWNVPVTINVAYNPAYTGNNQGGQSQIVFPAQAQRTSSIQGPVFIEGNIIPNLNLSLRPAVMLPTETDISLAAIVNANSPATQTNVLNVFNAGSTQNDAGTLSTLGSLPAGLLQQYKAPAVTILTQGVLGVTAQIDTLALNSFFTATDGLSFNGQGANSGGTITGVTGATSAAILQGLLDALPGFVGVTVSGGAGGPFTITFTSSLGNVTSSGINPLEFGNISGENMSGAAPGMATSPALALNYGTILNPINVSYPGGVTYRDIQFVNVMLGSGNDTFTVNSTPVQPASSFGADVGDSITVIQGGGGNNTLIANGGGGKGSSLILLGSTTQDGYFYNSTTANITGEARSFNNPGNNVIDARNDPNPAVLYSGPGNDTIYGGAGGDWILGGGGVNKLYGGSGDDVIIGADGLNLNTIYETPISQYEGVLQSQVIANHVAVPQRLSGDIANGLPAAFLVSAPPVGPTLTDADLLKAGDNTIYAGSGSNVVVGDLGVVTQVAGTQLVLTTGNLTSVSTSAVADFGNATIYGAGGGFSGIVWNGGGSGLGDDVILGGSGVNTIWGGNGHDVIIGNDGLVRWGAGGGTSPAPTLAENTDFNYGGGFIPGGASGTDYIHGGTLDSIILAGPGNNWIWGGLGNDLIVGQVGMVALDGLGISYKDATLIDTIGYVDPVTGLSAATTHGPGMTVGAGPGDLGTSGVSDVIQAYPQASAIAPVPVSGGFDILIGGSGNSWIGGSAKSDLIFGNNVTLRRQSNFNDPRFQTLTGTQIYTDTATTDNVNVSNIAAAYRSQSGALPPWAIMAVVSLDESMTTPSTHYGANYIAGGAGDNMIFGGQGTNTIQGAGSILGALNPPSLTVTTPGVLGTVAQVETLALNAFTTTYSLSFNGQVIDGISNVASAAWLASAISALTGFSGAVVTGGAGVYKITLPSAVGAVSMIVDSKAYAYRAATIQQTVAPGQSVAALGALHVNPSFEAPTDGNNYIEGGGGANTVIFGGTGQNDIIGGNSNLFSLTTPQQRPDSGNVIIFAGAGTQIAQNDSQSTVALGGAASAGDVLSLSFRWVSAVNGATTTQTFSTVVVAAQSQTSMVMSLLQAAQTNATLAAAGFGFSVDVTGTQLVVNSAGAYTLTGSVSGRATETLAIAQGGATVGTAQGNVHARNASVVIANNGDIFDLVGNLIQPDLGGFLTFNSDSGQSNYYFRPGSTTATNYYGGNQFVIPRAVQLLDYTYGGSDLHPVQAATDIGGTAEIHVESGDSQIYGGPNHDYLFGGSGNDLITGGYGGKWISGGNGITGLTDALGNPIINTTGILGGDGRLSISRNTNAYGEPLYGIEPIPVTALSAVIATSGHIEQSTINALNALTVTAVLTPYNVDPNGPQDAANGIVVTPQNYNDIIYGGLGNTFIHAGQGASNAISGTAALPTFFNDPVKNANDYSTPGSGGGVLGYNASSGLFGAYNQYTPRALIGGALNGFFLNFNANQGVNYPGSTTLFDGNKVIFGDAGNDWIVGGNGANTIFGGSGNDLIDGRRNLTLNGGANDVADNNPYFNSVIFGGAGSDILFAGGYYDRLIGGPGRATIYVVPVAPVILPYGLQSGFSLAPIGASGVWVPVVTQVPAGDFTGSSSNAPDLLQYLFTLASADGGDQLFANFAAPGVGHLSGLSQAQNGELGFEIGLAPAYYNEIQANTGGGGFANNLTVVAGSFAAASGALGPVTPVAGSWTLTTLGVKATLPGAAAIATFATGAYLPTNFTVTAQVTTGAPTGGALSNGYILFDYVSPTDFKFAGLDVVAGLAEIGHYNGSAWVIDSQTSFPAYWFNTYNLALSVSGDSARLMVNGNSAATYSWHDVNGVALGLNYGQIGLATNNAGTLFNNVVVSVPVAAPTWSYQTDLYSQPTYLDAPTSGTWTPGWNGYTATAPVGGFALAPIDLALAIGAAPGTFTLQAGSTIDISATLGQIGGAAGVTFDNFGGGFRFAAIMASAPSGLNYAAGLTPMKAGAQYVVLGHYTPGAGFVIDAYQAHPYYGGQAQKLDVIIDRDLVNVDVNNVLVLNYTYNRAVNGYGFGLLSWTGTNVFSNLGVTTNDANLARPFTPQSLAPTGIQGTTWRYATTFNYGPNYYDAPLGGAWSRGPSGYQGSAPANGLGVVTLDPALAFGLPAGALSIQSGASVAMQASFATVGGRAGLVFNLTANGDFDFAALLLDTQQVVLGHYTTVGGFVIDASQHYAFTNSTSFLTLSLVAQGNQVSLSVNYLAVLNHSYSAVVTGGQFGLLSWTGVNVFQYVSFSTNDPELAGSPDLPKPALAPTPTPVTWKYSTNFTGPTFLDAPASGSWTAAIQGGLTGTPPTGGVGIVVVDPGLALNLPPGTFTLPDGSTIQLTTQFTNFGGGAGVVFDQTADGAFKFAALLSSAPANLSYAPGLTTTMMVGTEYAVIGHSAPGAGFVIDAFQAVAPNRGWNSQLQVVLSGDVVSIVPTSPSWGWPYGGPTVSFAYGAVVTRGHLGLMSWVGTNTFSSLQVQTNAATLQKASSAPNLVPAVLAVIGSTFNYTTNFNIASGAVYLNAPVAGVWSTSSGGYTGAPSGAAAGIAPIDPGLALGMPAGTFVLNDGSATQITLQLASLNGAAGIAFNLTADGAYQFAALLTTIPSGLHYNATLAPMTAGWTYGVIGHYSPNAGYTIDAYQATTIQAANGVTFQVYLNGDLAAMSLAQKPYGYYPPLSLAFNFGAVITRGQFGLMAWTGATTFQQIQLQTNDPYLLNAPMHMIAQAAPTGPATGVTRLTLAQVDALLPTAIDRLASSLSLDAAAIAQLEAATITIAALPDAGLGATVGNAITLSPDAAGWGWFIDPKASTDAAFTVATAQGLAATPGAAGAGEMDLLTVEMHELAHVLGYTDTSSGLMSEYLTAGTRLAAPVHSSPVAPPTGGVAVAPANGAILPGAVAFLASSPQTPSAGQSPAPSGAGGQGGVGLLNVGAPIFANVATGAAAGGFAPSLISSSIVVAPTIFKLAAAHAGQNDSFVAFDDDFGWLGDAAAGSSTASQAPATGDRTAPTASASHALAAQPARIAWDPVALNSSTADADAAGPAWLEDFLNHMGQDEAGRNPNASIRVRPSGGGSP